METMKKNYKKPEVETYEMAVSQVICVSDMPEPAHQMDGDYDN